MSLETDEKVRVKMQEIARAEKIDLDPATNPNAYLTMLKLEMRVRREFPELNDGPQPTTINKSATQKSNVAIVSGNMRPLFNASKCNVNETYFALTGKEKPTTAEPKQSPVKIKVSFSKQPVHFSYEDLIQEYLREREMEDSAANRELARKFFVNLAERRGMMELDPLILRMNDHTYEIYKSVTAF